MYTLGTPLNHCH